MSQVMVGPRAIVTSPNFRVYARSEAFANEVARVAEETRKQLAIHWLGQNIPNWPEPCPLMVNDSPNLPASGVTKYTLVGGGVANFQMTVSGTQERIVDSVLPHEITHTILASHFATLGKPVPRWADEGACTTVEHLSERSKHDTMLVRYLGEGRGIPFATLFTLREYPADMMPLYAQGYSLSSFLIAQGGPRRFVQFLERGMQTEDWVSAIDEYYQYPRLGKLQVAWNRWVSDGGGDVVSYSADSLGLSTRAMLASNSNVATPSSSIPGNNNPVVNAIAVNGVNTDPNASMVRTASAQSPNGTQTLSAGPDSFVASTREPSRMYAALPNDPASVNANIKPLSNPQTNAINKSLDTSSQSYYLEQLRLNQGSAQLATQPQSTSGFIPATNPNAILDPNAIRYSSSQPAPLRTSGGGILRR
jgi:hypothetical protein